MSKNAVVSMFAGAGFLIGGWSGYALGLEPKVVFMCAAVGFFAGVAVCAVTEMFLEKIGSMFRRVRLSPISGRETEVRQKVSPSGYCARRHE